jgi:drug/metabolite transporter (DMT)-like permease
VAKGASGVGIAATLAAAVLWGSSFSVNDVGLDHVGPGTFVALRFALAAAVTLGFLALLGRADTHLLRQKWFWGLCLANALAFLLQYSAQTMTTPARTALFVNVSAFSVALFERALFGMRLGVPRWVAILLGFGGAAVLIASGDPEGLRGGETLGDALALAAGLVWSLYFVYNDRAVEREDPVHLVAWTFGGTALLLAWAPFADPWLSPAGTTGMDGAGALAILYSGLVTTALAFGLWAYGLTRIRASISAVILLVEILVASLVSLALGRESFGAVDLAGAALLCAAIVVASLVAQRDADLALRAAPRARPRGR